MGSPKEARKKDRPWLMRTYAGHSTAEASNALYRRNLEKGQTGLSVAFDLPTQTGYDPDHVLARGEVGRVGVPIAHLGDMRRQSDLRFEDQDAVFEQVDRAGIGGKLANDFFELRLHGENITTASAQGQLDYTRCQRDSVALISI